MEREEVGRMNRCDLVGWKSRMESDLPSELGIILEHVPYESRNGDPFPHWKVLFGDRGVLQCRESDLKVLG